MNTPPELWTIGHSTRSFAEFLEMLHAQRIQVLVDVRRYPMSRRHPQFNAEALQQTLKGIGLEYRPMAGLGGRRSPQPDSPNVGWRNASFRGYADYMQTEPFRLALASLSSIASQARTAVMCAEAVPWRCHRSLIADAMTSQGWRVLHILAKDKVDAHSLCAFARIDDGRVTYPRSEESDPESRLF